MVPLKWAADGLGIILQVFHFVMRDADVSGGQ